MDLSSFATSLDRMKESFLLAAAQGGNLQDCDSLIELGADVNWRGLDGGDTPLLAACRRGHAETVQFLLAHGADSNTIGSDSLSALHIVAQRNDIATLNVLLESNVSLRTTTKDGLTALDIAKRNQNDIIRDRLLRSSTNRQVPVHERQPVAANIGAGLHPTTNNNNNNIRQPQPALLAAITGGGSGVNRRPSDGSITGSIGNHSTSIGQGQGLAHTNSSLSHNNNSNGGGGGGSSGSNDYVLSGAPVPSTRGLNHTATISTLNNSHKGSGGGSGGGGMPNSNNNNNNHNFNNSQNHNINPPPTVLPSSMSMGGTSGMSSMNHHSYALAGQAVANSTGSSSTNSSVILEPLNVSVTGINSGGGGVNVSGTGGLPASGAHNNSNTNSNNNNGNNNSNGYDETVIALRKILETEQRERKAAEAKVLRLKDENSMLVTELNKLRADMTARNKKQTEMNDKLEQLLGLPVALDRMDLLQCEELERTLKGTLESLDVRKALLIRDQIDQQKEQRLCVVCQEAEKSVVLLPCRHMCLCEACSTNNQVQFCPLCRRPIAHRISVYA